MLRRLARSPWLYFGLAAALVLLALLSQLERGPRRAGALADVAKLHERTDLCVIFVVVDTLRADHLGSYGYARDTSPFMDRLAREGVRFETVEAQSSWTKTSMASLWTALWPVQTGLLRWNDALPERAVMPAEAFGASGFRTAGIYRNGWVAPRFGFGQGFDTYLRPSANATPARFERRTPSSHPLQGSDADVTQAALAFLASHGRERFFLYLHLMDVHQYAYDASTRTFGTAYVDAYDSAISWVDHNLGVLAKGLHDRGLLEKTLLVIAADHGEAFGEHGHEGHARDLYSETTRVPLIVSFPFALPRGVVVRELVRNVDVMPTIFELAGLPPIEGAAGRSLVPLILASQDEAGVGTPPAYAQLDRTWGATDQEPRPIVSVRTEDWKLIQAADGSADGELYDERRDPREAHDVAGGAAGARAALEPLAARYLALPPAPWGSADEVELAPEQLEQLRALGYVVR